jgi:hypothetical protein
MEHTVNIEESVEDVQDIIKNFLINKSDTVRFTAVNWREGLLLKKKGSESKDLKFTETIKNLENFLIKKERNNQRYPNVEQGNQEFDHYFYTLSLTIKSWLQNEDLLHGINFAQISPHFYCLEDPTFYKSSTMLGSIISHEPYIILYLTLEEHKKLKDQGVKFFPN